MKEKKAKRVWVRGVNVSVSPEAHARMVKKALEQKPRQTLRQYVNLIHGLPLNK